MFCEKAAHQEQMYKLSSPPSNEKCQNKRHTPSLPLASVSFNYLAHLPESSPVTVGYYPPPQAPSSVQNKSSYSITLNLLYRGVQHGRT